MAYLIETVNKINCKMPRNDGLQLREYLLSIHVRVLLHLNTERARLLGSKTLKLLYGTLRLTIQPITRGHTLLHDKRYIPMHNEKNLLGYTCTQDCSIFSIAGSLITALLSKL